jgi:hypothetical protein
VPCCFVGEISTGLEAKGERKRVIVNHDPGSFAEVNHRETIHTATIAVCKRVQDDVFAEEYLDSRISMSESSMRRQNESELCHVQDARVLSARCTQIVVVGCL